MVQSHSPRFSITENRLGPHYCAETALAEAPPCPRSLAFELFFRNSSKQNCTLLLLIFRTLNSAARHSNSHIVFFLSSLLMPLKSSPLKDGTPEVLFPGIFPPLKIFFLLGTFIHSCDFILFCIFKNYSWFTKSFQFLLYSKVTQPISLSLSHTHTHTRVYIYTYTYTFPFSYYVCWSPVTLNANYI